MIPGAGRITQLVGRVRSRCATSALILLYHRIAELPADPQLMSVTPMHFKEHLEVLGSKAYPIPLQQFVKALEERNIPERRVVITFDDGYSDNLELAKPLLQQFGFPATVFISAGAIENKHEFWWDALERILLLPGTLPETLNLDIEGETMQWELGIAAEYHEEDYWQNQGWSVEQRANPNARHSLYRILHTKLRHLPSNKQEKILDELSAWAATQSNERIDYLPLNRGEIQALAKEGLVEVGAHTVTHPVLSTLTVVEQQTEIQQSKRDLEELLGNPVNSFAYPYGSKFDYTIDTVGLVKEAGYKCACSNFPALVLNGTDRFQLPRIIIRDWDGDTFAHELRRWWGG